jgi:hypothetical protein
MEAMSELALPFQPSQEAANEETTAVEPGATTRPAVTTPEGSEPVHWQVVAKLAGLMQATIVAGRLQAAGIPARTWQEGAGQAIGLTVGLLGTGYVAVPEEYAEQAEAILAESYPVEESEELPED